MTTEKNRDILYLYKRKIIGGIYENLGSQRVLLHMA